MDDSERDALERMIQTAASTDAPARALLNMAWVADGLSADELDALLPIEYLSQKYADAAETLLSMTWIADGVSETEASFILGLYWTADESSASVAESVIAMAWVVDGVSDSEANFVWRLKSIADSSASAIANVIALAWVADGVSDVEADVIGSLGSIAESSASVAERVIAMSWIADGISDTEASFIFGLWTANELSASVVASVIALPWVADGVSDSEASFIWRLNSIAESSASIAERVIAMSWIADGISDTEVIDGVSDTDLEAVYWLAVISLTDADAAAQVVGMPFLQTLDAADAAALDSLGEIARSTEAQLSDILSRPMLKDGITDDETPIVSMLYRTLRDEPALADMLLDPDATTVERRTVGLSLAGDVDMVIVRTNPGASRSMNLLENAVRESENLMGEPLPTRYVGLLVGGVTGFSISKNFGTHMAVRPEYDVDDVYFPSLIAYEVAHYYWVGNAHWIDEGMAVVMALASENRRVGTPIDFLNAPCDFARSIKELETLPREQYWDCEYYLSVGLFVSLLRTLGEDAFWEGARNLYAASLDAEDGAGIDEVRQAFGPDASEVIERWYEGR